MFLPAVLAKRLSFLNILQLLIKFGGVVPDSEKKSLHSVKHLAWKRKKSIGELQICVDEKNGHSQSNESMLETTLIDFDIPECAGTLAYLGMTIPPALLLELGEDSVR